MTAQSCRCFFHASDIEVPSTGRSNIHDRALFDLGPFPQVGQAVTPVTPVTCSIMSSTSRPGRTLARTGTSSRPTSAARISLGDKDGGASRDVAHTTTLEHLRLN